LRFRRVKRGSTQDAFPRRQPCRLGGGRRRIRPVADREDEFLAHHAAEAAIDEVAHDLVALEMALAAHGQVASEGLEHADFVLAAELLLSLDRSGAEGQRYETDRHRPPSVLHSAALLPVEPDALSRGQNDRGSDLLASRTMQRSNKRRHCLRRGPARRGRGAAPSHGMAKRWYAAAKALAEHPFRTLKSVPGVRSPPRDRILKSACRIVVAWRIRYLTFGPRDPGSALYRRL